jgi:hypothetical protein
MLKGGSCPLKKLRTHSQPQSSSLGWLKEKVEQLLKEHQEQQHQRRPVPPDMPEMFPLQHDLFNEQAESPRRNRHRNEPPGASQRHKSPMSEFRPTESPRHREMPPVPPWAQEWPDVPRGQDGASEPREPEASQNYREWLLEEWDFEDIPPPRHLLEGRENPPRRAPHMPEWPPTAPWDDPRGAQRAQNWEEFSPLMDKTKEVERPKVSDDKNGGKRRRKRRSKKR